jgi:hypothetical protein
MASETATTSQRFISTEQRTIQDLVDGIRRQILGHDLVAPQEIRGVVCLEDGVPLDMFSLMTTDFLELEEPQS